MGETLRIEFGAGGRRLSGWIGHDINHDGVDITKPLPYATNSVQNIRAEHVCEHITPIQFLDFLIECHRILEDGGIVRIMMPVLDRLPTGHAIEIVRNHGHQGVYTTWLVQRFLGLAGFVIVAQTPRHVDDYHRHSISADRDELETARFEATKTSPPLSPWIV